MLRRFFGFSILLAATVSCSRDDTASAHPRKNASADGDGVAPRPSVVAPVSQPYKVVAVSAGGTITGTVDFDGTPPAPEIIRPTSDVNVCGNSIAANNLTMSGTKVAGAIVWLTDIRTGKGFPMERRLDLTNDGCILDPFVQVMSTSSTLNVSNDDRALHTNRLINVGTGEIAAVAPSLDARVDRGARSPIFCADVQDRHLHDRRDSRWQVSRPRLASEPRLRRRQCDCERRAADNSRISHPSVSSDRGARTSSRSTCCLEYCAGGLEYSCRVEHPGYPEEIVSAFASRGSPFEGSRTLRRVNRRPGSPRAETAPDTVESRLLPRPAARSVCLPRRSPRGR